MTTTELSGLPDLKISVRQVFGINSDMEVPAYSASDEHVPDLDEDYILTATPRSRSWRASPTIAA